MHNNLLKKSQTAILLLVFVSTLTITPSFLLLITSSWSSDDYYVAKFYQVYGLNGLFERVFNWSPRFFSEIFLYLYYNAVPHLGKPFTGAAILIIWLFLIVSIFIFVKEAIENNSLHLQESRNLFNTKIESKARSIYARFLLPLLITLILLAYFFYAKKPDTMFYLVVVSAAYVSALAGIILNLNFLLKQSNSSNITIAHILKLIVFGAIAASSWEMGAIFQLCFSSCLFLLLLLSAFRDRFNYLPFSRLTKINRWKLAIANLIPFLLSLYILFLLLSNRVGYREEITDYTSPLIGNYNASFVAAILLFFKELFFLISSTGEFEINFFSFSYAVTLKLSFLVLLTSLLYRAKIKLNIVVINACILSIILLVITNLTISFSSYYQLGTVFVSRQASFKSALIGLIIFIISLIIASCLHSVRDKNIPLLFKYPITLLASCCLSFLLLINLQIDYFKADFSNFKNIVSSNTFNWQANLDSEELFAVYTQVISYYSYRTYIDEGFYSACNLNRDFPNTVASRYMKYFDKQKLYVSSFNEDRINEYFYLAAKEIKTYNNQNKINFNCLFALGTVDKINNLPNIRPVNNVKIDKPIEVWGWVVNPDKSKTKRVIITLEDEKNILADVPVNISRPDVAQYLHNANTDSGWKAIFMPNPEWKERTIIFKVWAYDPATKSANFYQQFTLHFSSNL